jgi:hypothetical protein
MNKRIEPSTIEAIAHRTGLAPKTVRHCLQAGLVGASLTEDDLAELRRVRRLTALEVNLAGVEIIIRMRRRIIELQAEVARLKPLEQDLEEES